MTSFWCVSHSITSAQDKETLAKIQLIFHYLKILFLWDGHALVVIILLYHFNNNYK